MNEVEIRITGKVQGVGYRAWAEKAAGEFGITGYVQNLDDGSVEILAQGKEDDLKRFVDMCNKGPFFARVTDFAVEWHDKAQDGFLEFQIDHQQ